MKKKKTNKQKRTPVNDARLLGDIELTVKSKYCGAQINFNYDIRIKPRTIIVNGRHFGKPH